MRKEIWRSLVLLASRPGFPVALLLIATYKMGEAGVDAMYRIFLLDRGLNLPAIGVLCGTWGLGFSLAGSILGGWIGLFLHLDPFNFDLAAQAALGVS